MGFEFTGFPPNTFRFLRGLRKENNKKWFESHKADYQQFILRPMQELVEKLQKIGPRNSNH